MKKSRLTKLGSLFLGLSMALGVGAAISAKKVNETKAEDTWNLVTDASSLKAGDELVIASNAKGATAGDISSQVMTSISSTFSSDFKTISSLGSGTVVLTLGGSSGTWTLSNASGKKLGATAAKKVAWDSGTTTWSISIDSNNATIQCGTDSYGRFLYNSGSPRFIPYTSATSSSMLLPQLYRKTSGTTPTTKTLSSIAIEGSLEKTNYTVGESFDLSGIDVIATYSDNSTENVTSQADLTTSPDVAGLDTTSVTVNASYNGKTDSKVFNDISVTQSIYHTLDIVIADYADANNWVNSTKYTSVICLPITLSVGNGGGNTGKYYTNGESWRFYNSENAVLNISISGDYKITEITSNPSSTFSIAADGKTATFACSGSNAEFKSFTIKYEDVVVSSLTSISVSSNHREFYQDDAFVPETVTATYENGDTATVEATFSGYDLSTVGTQTVSVSYTEREVTRTTTYQITVLADTLNSITLGGTVSGSLNQDWDLSGVTATANYSHKGAVILTDFEPTTENAKPTAYGTYPVVVSVLFDGVTGTNTYEVEVKKDGRDSNNPFTAEEAAALTEATTYDVYVHGIVTQVDEISLDHGNTTFWIGENNAFKVYRASLDSSLGALAEDTIVVGQTVKVKGKINMYNSTSQLGQGGVIVEIIQSSNIPLTGISVTPAELTLVEGKTSQLTVTFEPFNASNKDVIFVSDDDSIATVSDEGLVTAIAVGTTTVTVVSDEGEFEDTCSVTVTEPVDVTGTYKLYSGELTEGDYLITYDNGAMKASVTSSRLDFTSITSVDNKVTVSDSSIVWHIALSGDYWTIYNENEGKYAIGTGTANKGGLGTDGSADGALWTASGEGTYEFVNKLNASKSVNSNLRRNGDYGFACYATGTGEALTLYKKSNGVVNVESVSLNETETTLEVGKTLQLTATVLPADADDLSVSWSTDKESVVTISDSGLVTAVAEGTATITVTTNDGSKTASCTIIVTASVSPVTTKYQLVNSSDELEDGNYLISYNDEGVNKVFNGTDAGNGYVAGEDGGKDTIVYKDGMAIITICSITDGYSLMVNGGENDGKYMYGTSGSNKLNFGNTASANTISISSGVATITSNTSIFRFNSDSGDTNQRFRYYKSSSTSYPLPSLYKLVEDTPDTPILEDGRYYLMTADGKTGLNGDNSGGNSPVGFDLTTDNNLLAFDFEHVGNNAYIISVRIPFGGVSTLVNDDDSPTYSQAIRVSNGSGGRNAAWVIEEAEGGYRLKQNNSGENYMYLSYNETYSQWRGYNTTTTGETLLKFVPEDSLAKGIANSLLNDIECDNGVTPPSVDAWNAIAEEFTNNVTIAHEKSLLTEGTANASSESEIEKALAKYDYIVGKYGSSTYADFLDRGPTSPARYGLSLGLDELKDSTWIVAIVAIAGLTAIGGCFFYRKRKQY